MTVTPAETARLEGLRSLLDPLAEEIYEHLGREPDAGDLLRVLAAVPPGQLEAAAELGDQLREVRSAKQAAVEAQRFPEAAGLRDNERTLMRRKSAELQPSPATLSDIRRRLGLPQPP